MIEIALSLGIIAFALIALMGVLPTGVNVQKENRQETIINQDGTFLLEAIRSGAKGLDFLTNHFEAIIVSVPGTGSTVTYVNRLFPGQPGGATGASFMDGRQIVGLLSSRPQSASQLNQSSSGLSSSLEPSVVKAYVRAITGVASDKTTNLVDLAFRYELRVETMPFVRPPLQRLGDSSGVGILYSAPPADLATSHAMRNNLYEIRLTLRWPLYQQGNEWRTGRHRKTFRTLVSGELNRFNPAGSVSSWFFFQPNSYTAITNISKPRL